MEMISTNNQTMTQEQQQDKTMKTDTPKQAVIENSPPPYEDYAAASIENTQLKKKLQEHYEQEEQRLRDSKGLFETVESELKAAFTQSIQRIVQEQLVHIAKPVMTMVSHHKDDLPLDISTSALFPVYDKSKILQKKIHEHIRPYISLDTLLPGEMIVAQFDVVSSCRQTSVYHTCTSFGRKGTLKHWRCGGACNGSITFSGEVVPLTKEYTEILLHYSESFFSSNGYEFFDNLLATYQKNYPLASEMYKNNQILQDLNDRNIAIEVRETALALAEQKNIEERKENESNKLSLVLAKEQLKKRLKSIAIREKEMCLKNSISDMREVIRKASIQLIDACDTVDNELIGHMVQGVLDKLDNI
jgi:hypothetical protein